MESRSPYLMLEPYASIDDIRVILILYFLSCLYAPNRSDTSDLLKIFISNAYLTRAFKLRIL